MAKGSGSARMSVSAQWSARSTSIPRRRSSRPNGTRRWNGPSRWSCRGDPRGKGGSAVIDGTEAGPRPFFLAYRPTLPRTWWLRNRRYGFFGLRELTAIPVALWLLSYLYELWRVGRGPNGYYPSTSPLYIAFSAIC